MSGVFGAASKRGRVQLDCGTEKMTKDSFADECDINKIMKRFERTGALTHLSQFGPEYGYAPALDFRESMEIVRKGQEMFDALPAELRKRFNHEPSQFLEFVQDENNHDEAVKLGLAEPKKKPEAPPTPPA